MNEALPAPAAPMPHVHIHQHKHTLEEDHAHEQEDWHGVPPWRPRSAPSPAAWAALVLIGVYRRAVSPVMPPACRFLPTCSAYGYEAIARYGILSGGRLALWRILRCNPFGGSGYDPVP